MLDDLIMYEIYSMQELKSVIETAIVFGEGVGVFIKLPDLEQPELIYNPNANLIDKLHYYTATYNEDLEHQANNSIRIVGYLL